MYKTIKLLALVIMVLSGRQLTAQDKPAVFEGEKTAWHDGFDRYDFIMDTATLAIRPFKAPASEGFGVAGADIGIGADILVRAALSDEFGEATGRYFDNDSGRFASPHPDALDAQKSQDIVGVIEAILLTAT